MRNRFSIRPRLKQLSNFTGIDKESSFGKVWITSTMYFDGFALVRKGSYPILRMTQKFDALFLATHRAIMIIFLHSYTRSKIPTIKQSNVASSHVNMGQTQYLVPFQFLQGASLLLLASVCVPLSHSCQNVKGKARVVQRKMMTKVDIKEHTISTVNGKTTLPFQQYNKHTRS